MQVEGIFCVLAKAFDCMNLEILIAELHLRGIQGVSEYSFRSCLTNGRRKVEVALPDTTQQYFL